ncbi:hypothetical protein NECAME_14510 [Necator americanus]|uniref:Uncharacterized protein n=1 Tax=Necator americanus TaxID=51031 RepID=W2SPR2_NECAM|nr:hypothetical protein NECAME_14510 [Necator americanus]ETN70831.1 hypothetical protein NECAME_14510 [Necator americanus]
MDYPDPDVLLQTIVTMYSKFYPSNSVMKTGADKQAVVQEYERAVIFRLGRLIGGGAKGPGILSLCIYGRSDCASFI